MGELRSNDTYVTVLAVMYGVYRNLSDEAKNLDPVIGMDLRVMASLYNYPSGTTFSGIKAHMCITKSEVEQTDARINALIKRGVIASTWKHGLRILTISRDMQQMVNVYRAVPYGHRLLEKLQLSKYVTKVLEKYRHRE